jgi:hypothetical protein
VQSILVCLQGVLKASYFTYVGFNATQEASQKTRNIVQVIEFAILSIGLKEKILSVAQRAFDLLR